jgi:8-oxo-dGTP pyrophosphatase MutT (NUDIX family)
VLRLEHWLPARLHIAGLQIAHAVRVRWWRISGRRVRGVRVLAIDPYGRVLLIRHSYGSAGWMLPGGGLAGDEDVALGGCREVLEETAVAVADPIVLGRTDAPDSIHESWLVAGWSADDPVPDGREIVAAGWFALDRLPDPIAPWLAAQIAERITAAQAARPSG